MHITSNDEYLIVTPDAADDEGSYGDNTVYYVDLSGNDPTNWPRRPLVETFNAAYNVSLLSQKKGFVSDKERPL